MGPELLEKGCENFEFIFFFLQFALGCLETILEEQVQYYLSYYYMQDIKNLT